MLFFFYEHFNWPNLLKYQTFRATCAFLLAFFFALFIGEPFIRFLKKHQKNGQPIRDDGPQSHITSKKGTPTMGGVLIIMSVMLSVLCLANLSNPFIWIALFAMLSSGCIGFLDDFKKLTKNNNAGISGRKKLFLQVFISFILSLCIAHIMGYATFSRVFIPFLKDTSINLSVLSFLSSAFIMVGSSNAVNLTDGLDGLAIFPVMIASLSFGIIAYVVGHAGFAQYLFVPYIAQSSELTIFLASWVGASLGFLWYNAPPAKIFMGDTGSLAAGASLSCVAIMVKHEIVWSIIGGLFVAETLSVIVQVYYYKMTKKRIFKMSPFHHHFEHIGWSEPTIVIRFWIVSVILAIIGLASLKIR